MNRFCKEYGKLIANDNEGRVLVHTVLLPNETTGSDLCEMSDQLAFDAQCYVYYKLMPKADWSFVSRLISGQHSTPDNIDFVPIAKNKYSYPHLTLFHAWILPSDIPKYLETVAAQAPSIEVPDDLKMTGPLHFELPHWCDAKSVAGTTDDIFWNGVEPAPLCGLQDQLASSAAQFESCIITTPLGENWKAPHFTLLGRAKSLLEFPIQAPETHIVQNPKLAIGLSGRNGQFRAPIMIINRSKRPTSLDIANLRLQTLLQIAA